MYVSMYVHFCKVKKEVLEVKLQVAKGINTKVQQRSRVIKKGRF